jgi:hypothetical protein
VFFVDQYNPKFFDDEQDHNTEFDDPLLHSPHSTPHNYRVFLSSIAKPRVKSKEKPQPPALDSEKSEDDEIF